MDFENTKLFNFIIQNGGSNYNINLNFIISIILITISLIIFYIKSSFVLCNGKITNIITNFTNCILTIKYNINNITYNNNIVIPYCNKYSINQNIQILYNSSDFNNIEIYNSNYLSLSILLIIVALSLMIL